MKFRVIEISDSANCPDCKLKLIVYPKSLAYSMELCEFHTKITKLKHYDEIERLRKEMEAENP